MRLLMRCGLALLLLAGCNSGHAVRDLGAKETESFTALAERLADNEKAMRRATDELGRLAADYAEKEFVLERSLAKAKRLDAMRAPWASPPGEFHETQRAVVLYHLYETEIAEQAVLDARIRQQVAATQQSYVAFRKLRSLTKDASKNLEVVLKHLNQPPGARILAVSSTLLDEVTAFRRQLESSENPRLRQAADDVARAEEHAIRAMEKADKALDVILGSGGK